MNRVLHIAKDLSLPLDAVTQTMGFIARKGGGKTYLAGVIAEQMLDAGAQVVVLDLVGVWYGLRIAADGKGKGKDIFVMGGLHGDLPLTPESGAAVARLLVEKRISAVLDISMFRIGERKRFAAAFGEELLHLKKSQRTPMHLVIEEAQLIIPQRVGPDETRMVGAFEHIVRLGRNYGIGASLITQRPQSVNKEVLSQVECLCVLQVNGSHERKALEEWVQEAGADRELIGELPGLAQGEGYVWSPSWLRVFKRVHFAKKTTFDASATPEVGKAAPAAKLSAVDVEALRADLAEVVASAEQDDPKALRRRIAELEAELKKGLRASSPAPKIERVEIPVLSEKAAKRLEKIASELLVSAAEADSAAKELRATIAAAIAKAPPTQREELRAPMTPARNSTRNPAPAPVNRPVVASRARAGDPQETALGKGERIVLTAVAQHAEGVTRQQVTILTGYKRSTRDAYLQRLSARGAVGEEGDRIFALLPGLLGADFRPLPTGAALLEHWRQKLPEGERVVLNVAVEAYPEAVERERISEVTGYKRSTRDAYVQRLCSRRLLNDVGRGRVCAAPELFG